MLGIGVSIYEMVTGEVVNDSNENFPEFFKAMQNPALKQETLPDPWKSVGLDMINFLAFIFDPVPETRPNIFELFEHPFMHVDQSRLDESSNLSQSLIHQAQHV